MKIFFVGDLNKYGRSFQRFKALERLGYTMEGLSTAAESKVPGVSYQLSFYEKVRYKLGFHFDHSGINQQLMKDTEAFTPDIIWIEKVLCLKPTTLKSIRKNLPNVKIIHCCEDDMYARHNTSVYFKKSIPLFEIIFTTKSYNCNSDELPSLGAKKVEQFKNCYDPTLLKPVDVKSRYKSEVSFIGTFEKDRAEKCLFLAENGIEVRIWGNGWQSYFGRHKNLKVENKPLYNEEFVRALCSSKINLCFLRKINRDLQTSRSVEIPACGAFMLAERTSEHLGLFVEDEEAAFFDNDAPQDLLRKVRYYLGNEDDRLTVAAKGRERCLASGYSHDEELERMIKRIKTEG